MQTKGRYAFMFLSDKKTKKLYNSYNDMDLLSMGMYKRDIGKRLIG